MSANDSNPAPQVPGWATARTLSESSDLSMPISTRSEAMRTLGRYTVLRTLGRGGMSVVYEAVDPTLNRRVALKVLQAELEERYARRLLREARALAKLSHPNVVQVHEVGEAEGRSFIVMERAQGQTLRQWQEQEPRPGWRECIDVYLQAGQGLSVAHQQGLVHRDFKPNNAVIDDEGQVKVLDFGLVREFDEADEPSSNLDKDAATQRDRDEPTLTRPGAVMGTPAYMSPEQWRGEPADARSDQFAFCVSLYEAVYGERPTDADKSTPTAGAEQGTATGQTDAPTQLIEIVRRGLSERPEQRWPTMDALLAELRRLVAPKPKRRWGPPVVIGGLGALGVVFALQLGGPSPCTNAAAHLEDVWNTDRRRALESAILSSELSFAPDTWGRVEQRLDDYASAWTKKHVEVCEATNIDKEQSAEVMDLRMECLQHARVALRETVDVLSNADPFPVMRAVSVVDALPPVSRCDRVDALRSKLEPAEPELAQLVARQRERLQQAKALSDAGMYDAAHEVADEAAQQAQTLAYPPLMAEASLWRGVAGLYGGRFDESERDLLDAYMTAAEVGDESIEVEAAVSLISLLGDRLARQEEALWWGRIALARSKGERLDREAQSHVENGIGTVLLRMGEYEQALEHCRMSLEVLEEEPTPSKRHLANALNSTANVLYSLNRVDEAREHYQRAYELAVELLGPRHPMVASLLLNIGNTLRREHRLDEAQEHYQRALDIRTEAFGPEHSEVAMALDNSANVLLDQSKLTEAIKILERSAAIKVESLGPEHPSLGLTLQNIGTALNGLGRDDDAIGYYRRALSIREASLGPDHIDVGHSLRNLAPLLARQGEGDEAIEMLQRAMEIYRETLGPMHFELVGAYGQKGIVHELRGEPDAALSAYRRALELVDQAMDGDPLMRARLLRAMGDVWLEREEFTKALALFREALALREGTPLADDRSIAESHTDIGMALRGVGALDEGQAELQRALELLERSLPADDPQIAEALIAVASIAADRGEFEDARAKAQRALSIAQTSNASADQLARARFVLARCLWSKPAQRARAHELATLALSNYAEARGSFEDDKLEVEQWIDAHVVR